MRTSSPPDPFRQPLPTTPISNSSKSHAADGTAVPFTLDHHTLHFFSGARENVRVSGRNRESAYALTLPEMWDVKWQPPAKCLARRFAASRADPVSL